MNPDEYLIGIVISPCGVNALQLADIWARIAFIVKHSDPARGIGIRILGFGQRNPEQGVPSNLLNLAYRHGVKSLCCTPGWESKFGLFGVIRGLLACDEIWCVPGAGQATIGSKTRVAQIYRAGVEDPKHGHLFKLIPTWVAPTHAVKVKKAKKKPAIPPWDTPTKGKS